MSVRLLTTAGAIIVSSLVLFTATVHLGADQATPRAAAKPWTAPLTPWGDPDIQGTFTTDDELGVPFERPAQFGTRTDVTDTEFADRQAQVVRHRGKETADFDLAALERRDQRYDRAFGVEHDEIRLRGNRLETHLFQFANGERSSLGVQSPTVADLPGIVEARLRRRNGHDVDAVP